MISVYSLSANQISFLTSLSQQKIFSLTPNTSHSLKTFYPHVLRPRSSFKHLVSVLIFSLFMHSCILDLGFGDFQNFWGFCGPIWYIYSNSHFHILNNITHISTHFFTHTYFKNYKQHYSNYSTKHPLSFSWNFWVGFCEIVSICSCITFSLHSNYVSCIIDVCLIIVECVLVGFDWVSPMMQFKFCTSHVHAYFMHTYPFIPIYGCDFVSLSLSLSHRLRTAPKATPSQNHLQGFGSSSFDPIPPHHVWFRDEKARKDFLENF